MGWQSTLDGVEVGEALLDHGEPGGGVETLSADTPEGEENVAQSSYRKKIPTNVPHVEVVNVFAGWCVININLENVSVVFQAEGPDV